MEGDLNEQKKEVPAPPAPEISIRTMESDIKALEKGGGEMAAPKTFSQPQQEGQENKFKIAGYAGPEKPIFSSMSGVLPKEDAADAKPDEEESSWVKTLLIIVAIIAVVAAVGFFGYFIFSNWIFPAQMPAV